MGESRDLKEGNKVLLAAYLAVHGLVVAWTTLGWPSSLDHFKAIVGVEWIKAAILAIPTLLVSYLNRLGRDRVKTGLVFWRTENALPGCRAFTELAPKDPRIDLASLKQAVGGMFPISPGEQNKTWYRLYQKHKDSPSIQDAHRDYLLFRDITWLTLPVATASQVFLLFSGKFKVAGFHFLICAGLYLAVRIAAVWAAESFVRSVMAVAGSDHEPPPSAILQP